MLTTDSFDTALLQAPLGLLESRFPERLLSLPGGEQVAVRSAAPVGAASTVVLLHGISSGAASWLHTAMPLSEQARVLAWDAPGYGQSTPLLAAAPRDTDYAQRLHQVLMALEVTRCTLVGHSLGALMACAYARRAERCQIDRLILVSPAAGYGAPDKATAQAHVRQERHEALQRLGVAGLAENATARLLSPHTDAATRAWVQWNAARLNPAGYLQAVEMLCRSDLAGGAPITVPLEVHCGELDIVTPSSACQALAERLGGPFALIRNAGHASPVEQAGSVAHLITRALQPDRHHD